MHPKSPTQPLHPSRPALFEEYFGMGSEQSTSPFLTSSSRRWAFNLTLKASLFATLLLIGAFAFRFVPELVPLSHLLLVCIYFLVGVPSLIESIEDLIDFNVNIEILMTLAAFSSVFIGSSMEGALLLVLFALSGAIEDAVTLKAKDSISTLHNLTPSTISVVGPEGDLIQRSIKDTVPGTIILVKAGEIVPLDGFIVQGSSSVSLAHLTGESLPVRKQVGDEVSAGTRNIEGALTLRVIRTGVDSALSKIIHLVTQAQEEKPRLQSWFDSLTRGYSIIIILLTILFALLFPYVFNISFFGVEGSLYRALAFLIAASPCALILALPVAYLSSISTCAKQGILLKGGVTLEALAACKIIAFDKTGTLTTGELQCSSIEPIGAVSTRSPNEVLSIAYTLEQNVVHPVASAIVRLCQEKNIKILPSQQFRSIPGYGMEALIEGKWMFMGQIEFVLDKVSKDLQVALREKAEENKKKGAIVAVLLIEPEVYLFTFHDTLRPNLKETIQDLKSEKKWKIVMLTGDHEINAKEIADQLGIDEYYANLKPKDKLDYVNRLSQEGGLAMVGDGVNDAPALASATVGICMGKVGSGTALEAADVILLQDNINQLRWLFDKAKMTKIIVAQNLLIATGAIVVASVPALAGWIPLWLAVVFHEGGTVTVGLNALRLLKK